MLDYQLRVTVSNTFLQVELTGAPDDNGENDDIICAILIDALVAIKTGSLKLISEGPVKQIRLMGPEKKSFGFKAPEDKVRAGQQAREKREMEC